MPKSLNKNRILVISAHPDDEIIGCGGTIARLSEQGHDVHILILGEGITSRQNKRNTNRAKLDLTKLKLQSEKAGKIIGAKEIKVLNFPDNRFDNVNLLDIIKAIESVKNEFCPQIIFTHYANDLNIDHRLTFQATMTACRPLKNETVTQIYSFEILSSTEWQYNKQSHFSPTKSIVLEKGHIDAKIAAIQMYSSEICEYPHPRSLEGLEILAKWRGMNVGHKYAEAFEVIRDVC